MTHYFQKHAVTGSVLDKKRAAKSKLHTPQHINFVNSKMEEIPDLSARKLTELLQAEFGINMSISAVRVFRRKLGWVAKKTRYCQMIRALCHSGGQLSSPLPQCWGLHLSVNLGQSPKGKNILDLGALQMLFIIIVFIIIYTCHVNVNA